MVRRGRQVLWVRRDRQGLWVSRGPRVCKDILGLGLRARRGRLGRLVLVFLGRLVPLDRWVRRGRLVIRDQWVRRGRLVVWTVLRPSREL